MDGEALPTHPGSAPLRPWTATVPAPFLLVPRVEPDPGFSHPGRRERAVQGRSMHPFS
jgi:hypothetical protein